MARKPREVPDIPLPPEPDPLAAPPAPVDRDVPPEPPGPGSAAPATSGTGPAPTPDPRRIELATAGDYEIVRALGTGGMAQVFLARRRGAAGFERVVALKAIQTELADDDKMRRMFVQEARLASHLHHRNIAQVFDLQERGNTYYLVMEYVAGLTVREAIKLGARKGRSFSHGFTTYVVEQVADALQYAHTLKAADGSPLGIVHRDVTPANVMVAEHGDVKLLDFGIAYSLLAGRDRTKTGERPGTFKYLSPEQAEGARDLDGRSDIFTLCIVLVELASSRNPFDASSDSQVILNITQANPVHVESATHGLPDGLKAIIHRGLARSRDERFQNAAELARALRAFRLEAGIVFGPSEAAAELARLRELPDDEAGATKPEASLAAPPALAPPGFPPAKDSASSLGDTGTPRSGAPALGPASPSPEEIKRREEIRERLRNPQNPRRRLLVPAIVIGVVILLGNGVVFLLVNANRAPPEPKVVAVKTDAEQRAEEEAREKALLPPPAPVQLAATPATSAGLEPAPKQAPAPTSPKTPTGAKVRHAAAAPIPEAPPAPVYRHRSLDSSTATSFNDGPARPGEKVPAVARGTLIAARLSVPADPGSPGPLTASVTSDVAANGAAAIPKGSTLLCSSSGAGYNGRLAVTCDGVDLHGRVVPMKGTAFGRDQRPGLPLAAPPSGGSTGGRIAGDAALDFAGRLVNRIAGDDVAGDALNSAASAGRDTALQSGSSSPTTTAPPIPKGTAFFVFVESFGGGNP